MTARPCNQRAAGALVSGPARFDSAASSPPDRRPAFRVLGLCIGVILLAGFSEPPPPRPFDPAGAAKQGRELVAEILSQRPAQSFTNAGVLKTRDAKNRRSETPVKFEAIVPETNSPSWSGTYETIGTSSPARLTVFHSDKHPGVYSLAADGASQSLTNNQSMIPFAGSDFWLADLGLEFFHWPEQKVLRSELRKTRLCRVLESVNPQPATNAYSRVVSWIDDESRGILHAEAYDSQDRRLKEFDTKKFKKVNGAWRLEQMEIYNVQTRSRTQIEFEFDSK